MRARASSAGSFFRNAAAGEVEQHLFVQAADGCAVVAFHILFAAQNQRNGLVDHAVAQQQNVLLLLALGAGTSGQQVNAARGTA